MRLNLGEDALWAAMGFAGLAFLAAWALVADGPFMGVIGMGLAAWLFC